MTHVGSGAFQNCGWFHDQPSGVVYFGKAAYAYKGTMPENTVLALKEGTVSFSYSFIAGQTEMNPTFDYPTLAGLILPQSCKYVDAYAFAGAKNMKFIDLGGVQYIGREAFNNSACESIVLPDSVRFVGSNAFSAPYIKAIHLNDSKNPFASHKDRHEKIGEGSIGLEAFERMVNHPRLKGIPIYLETPNELEGYAREILLLRNMEK